MNENQSNQNTSSNSITFDYNQLYANNNQLTSQPHPQPQQETTTQQVPTIQSQQEIIAPQIPITPTSQGAPIIFNEEKNINQEVVNNVIPTFDSSVLEDESNSTLNQSESLVNSMKSDTQQEKEQYKKNLLFILAFFGVLIVAVLFIFPLIKNY